MSSRCRGCKAGVSVVISAKREVMARVHSAYDFEQVFRDSFPHFPASLRRPLAESLAVRMPECCLMLCHMHRMSHVSSTHSRCAASALRLLMGCAGHTARGGRRLAPASAAADAMSTCSAADADFPGWCRRPHVQTWGPARSSAAWWGPDWPFSATQPTQCSQPPYKGLAPAWRTPCSLLEYARNPEQ